MDKKAYESYKNILIEDAIGVPSDEVELEVTGKLNDGTSFKGIATIKAIQK